MQPAGAEVKCYVKSRCRRRTARRPPVSTLFRRLGRESATYSSPSARWESPTIHRCLSLAFRTKTSVARMIQKSKEFVVNVCSQNQLHAVDRSRDLSGRNVEDKFIALGLETVPAKQVQAPLVANCHANVECRLVKEVALDGLFLFVGEALASYVDDQVPPVGRLAGKTFRLDGPI